MDLDFSFALVSSLTPRRKAEKSSTTEVLKKTNLLKTKLNLPIESQNLEEISHQKGEEKENLIPKEHPKNKDEFLKPTENKRNSNPSNNIHRRESNDKSGFSINMENIAVRRNRTRGRKKIETSPLQPCDNVLEISDENAGCKPNLPSEGLSLCALEIINISSDRDKNFHTTQLNKNKSKNCRGKSHRLSDSSVHSSLEIVESSCSEVKGDLFDNCRSLRSLSAKKHNVKTRSARTSGKSETSLSTAYDSDSFQVIHRHGVKVIPETPDSDKSFSEKRKSSILSFISEENKEKHSLRSYKIESPKKSGKRRSSEIRENEKRYSIESSHNDLRLKTKSSLLSFTSEKNKQEDEFGSCVADSANEDDKLETINSACKKPALFDPSKPYRKHEIDVRLKMKLRTSSDATVSDMFKLESTIKDHSPHGDMKNEFSETKLGSTCCSNNENPPFSMVSKGRNPKVTDLNNTDLVKKKRIKEKELINQKNISKQKTGDCSKEHLQVTKNKHCSPISPKMSTLVLPSEVIPKFEHINRWLKSMDTQEKTIRSLENDSVTTEVISKKDVVPIKNKCRVSLSPRIKKKKEKAKTSLEEEQKLFEELYGADYGKRLSDEVDEVTSRTSCQDSVEFSENVLDKLYGKVWQKNTAVTRSEPRKGREKTNSKNKTPFTERKKHRTSIYEVFSSSSSEDRFEEFLENVQRGKVESTKTHSGRPGTPEFINDSDSEDNGSLVFYQNIISSTVKDEVNNLKSEEIKAGQDTHKVNRRRLSFGSSKDDGCSEGGKSTKPTNKDKKSSSEDKTKTKKSRSKKKTNKYIEGKGDDDIDGFSLVTPLRVKGKKIETDFSEKVINPDVFEVPRSVGKSKKTPKNPTRKKELSNSEERLKATYLRECDFKVPKSASKTPSRSAKPDIPSSPALSFLSSLSEMTAGLPCHPDALVYKKNFKTKREELAKRLFSLYNKEIFDNQLPGDMLIQWSTRMTSTSGYCYNKRIHRDNQVLRSSRIVLSTKILDRADRLRDTLIHELCHAATWIVHATSDGHGPLWRSWADKANRRFPELPVIKRCHDYSISTKFTYKCMSCGYSIGRHTKSLDTERKRCGYCFGKFQVFVTAKMSSASVTSGSDSVVTPRNPTGFALFVKENYATVKKENNVPHAQVMKLLSQKFAEVKISKQNAKNPIVIE